MAREVTAAVASEDDDVEPPLSSRSSSSSCVVSDLLYQVHFSCEEIGRYYRNSKRRLTWIVGSLDGFDHSIELVWSVKSGKTRVVWNGTDISHLFRAREGLDNVSFAWQASTGELIQVQAHADDMVDSGSLQYDLLLDGRSFFTLPTRTELDASIVRSQPQPQRYHPYHRSRRDDLPEVEHCTMPEERTPEIQATGVDYDDKDELSDLGSGDKYSCGTPSTPEIDFRLSMVGLTASEHSSNEVVDELHSELYSPMLETLRQRITEYLPQLEDVVSRAIINAFFVDNDTSGSSSGLGASTSSLDLGISSSSKKDPNQLEVDSLKATFDWVRLNKRGSSDPDLLLSYMQKQIDAIFFYVRNDELSPEQASRILLSVACVLGLEFAKPLSRDTLILTGLGPATTEHDLYQALSKVGTVSVAAVSSCDHGFGFVRFQDIATASFFKSTSCSKAVSIQGHVLTVMAVSSTCRHMDKPKRTVVTKLDDRRAEPPSTICCIPDRPSSPIPHLMMMGSMDFVTYSASTVAAAPNKPRPISHASISTGSTASPQSVAEW